MRVNVCVSEGGEAGADPVAGCEEVAEIQSCSRWDRVSCDLIGHPLIGPLVLRLTTPPSVGQRPHQLADSILLSPHFLSLHQRA